MRRCGWLRGSTWRPRSYPPAFITFACCFPFACCCFAQRAFAAIDRAFLRAAEIGLRCCLVGVLAVAGVAPPFSILRISFSTAVRCEVRLLIWVVSVDRVSSNASRRGLGVARAAEVGMSNRI